jgi:hypothetical protein
MINELTSIGVGSIFGAVMAITLRGTRGLPRMRRGLSVGIPSIILMGAWALWRDSFPLPSVPTAQHAYGSR